MSYANERRHHWDSYCRFLGETLGPSFRARYDIWHEKYQTYAQFGVVFGGFSAERAELLQDALTNCSPEPVSPRKRGRAIRRRAFDGRRRCGCASRDGLLSAVGARALADGRNC